MYMSIFILKLSEKKNTSAQQIRRNLLSRNRIESHCSDTQMKDNEYINMKRDLVQINNLIKLL